MKISVLSTHICDTVPQSPYFESLQNLQQDSAIINWLAFLKKYVKNKHDWSFCILTRPLIHTEIHHSVISLVSLRICCQMHEEKFCHAKSVTLLTFLMLFLDVALFLFKQSLPNVRNICFVGRSVLHKNKGQYI